MILTENFYNKVAEELMSKYFPTITWHRDNFASQKATYNLELFSNGCLNYNKLVKKLAKYCMAEEKEIKTLLSKYLTTH